MNKIFYLQADSTSNYRFQVRIFFQKLRIPFFLSRRLILACTSLVNFLILCDSA
jgi:hypothetical protein